MTDDGDLQELAPNMTDASEASAGGNTDKALRGLRHIGLARLFTQPLSWGLTAITIHLLSPRDYGLVATGGILVSFAEMLLDGGLAEVLVSQRELSPTLQGAAVSAVIGVSSFLAAMIFAAAPLASSFFHSPPLRAVLDVEALYLPFSALAVVPIAQLSKRMLFSRIAIVQTVTSIAQGLFTLGLAYAGAAYWSLILGNLLGSGLLRVTLLWLCAEQKPVPNLRLRTLAPLVRNSFHMIGQRLTYFSIENFDLFLLSRVWGPAALGSYSVARTLSHTPLDKISGLTSRISVPAFAAKTEMSDQLRGMRSVISITSILAFPLWWIMGIASQIALPLVFGSRWHNVVIPFVAFSAILPLRTLYAFLNSCLVGTGRTGITLKNIVSWATILLPSMAAGVIWGVNGVALSVTVAFPIVFYIAMRRVSGAFGVGAWTLLEPMMIPALCAGLSASGAEAILLSLSNHMSPLMVLISQCCFGAVSYLLLLRSLGRSQYQQTVSLGRRLAQI